VVLATCSEQMANGGQVRSTPTTNGTLTDLNGARLGGNPGSRAFEPGSGPLSRLILFPLACFPSIPEPSSASGHFSAIQPRVASTTGSRDAHYAERCPVVAASRNLEQAPDARNFWWANPFTGI
jgi:hypothetical protein